MDLGMVAVNENWPSGMVLTVRKQFGVTVRVHAVEHDGVTIQVTSRAPSAGDMANPLLGAAGRPSPFDLGVEQKEYEFFYRSTRSLDVHTNPEVIYTPDHINIAFIVIIVPWDPEVKQVVAEING
jgi:hypothetical protein